MLSADLKDAIRAATGGDRDLDQKLASGLGAPLLAYTGSVDAALDLIRHALPGWGWHVGWHADGIRPYASLHDADRTVHVEAVGPSVPVALLRAMAQALNGAPETDDRQAASAPAGDSRR